MADYTEKSMNGIITIDDGMGTIIQGGKVSTTDLQLQNLICNDIQGVNPSDNINLYSNTTGIITIGGNTGASAITIKTDNLEALTGTTINIGKVTETLSYRGTNKLNNLSSISPSSDVNLFQDLNSVILNIATNLFTNGTVNVGGLNGRINMGRFRINNNNLTTISATNTNLFSDFVDNFTTLNIAYASSNLASANPLINIGGDRSILKLGSLFVDSSLGTTNIIAPKTNSILTIGTTSGALTTGLNLNSTGQIKIESTGTGANGPINLISSGSVNLLSTGSSGISIANTTTASISLNNAGPITLTSTGTGANGPINISSASTCTINATNIFLGPSLTASAFVNVGSISSNSSSGLRLFQPITCVNGSNWGTPATNQVGGVIPGVLSGTTSSVFPTTKGTLTLGTGCYILNGNIRFDSFVNPGIITISDTTNTHNFSCCGSAGNTTSITAHNISRMVQVAAGASQQFFLVVSSNVASNLSGIAFYAMKLA